MASQLGFFDLNEQMRRLSGPGDQLEVFAEVVDFEMFRSELELAVGYSDGARSGRPPFDPVMMLMILIIQAQHKPRRRPRRVSDLRPSIVPALPWARAA